jgi:hypothetical protein
MISSIYICTHLFQVLCHILRTLLSPHCQYLTVLLTLPHTVSLTIGEKHIFLLCYSFHFILLLIFFPWDWSLNSGLRACKAGPSCSGYFRHGVSRTLCPGWPRASILLVSVCQVARITGVSHLCLPLATLFRETWLFVVFDCSTYTLELACQEL